MTSISFMDVFRVAILQLVALILCGQIISIRSYSPKSYVPPTPKRTKPAESSRATPPPPPPTIRNPHSNRKIQVGGPTYQDFLEEGTWVQHDGTFHRLDLQALCDYQNGSKDNNHDDTEASQAVHSTGGMDWYRIFPSVVVVEAGEASESPQDNNIHESKGRRRPLSPDEAALLEEQLLFVHKPSGWNCVPARNGPKEDALSFAVAKTFGDDDEDVATVKPCHRLDRDTSGIMVFGLTSDAHREVSKQFEARTTTKTYLALVADHPSPNGNNDSGIIDLPIGKQRTAEGFNRWTIGGEKSRQATTEWKVEKQYTTAEGAKFAKMKLSPKTGRGHQLRLHMRAIGCPILGDTLHATNTGIAACAPRLCLHAWKLQLDWNGLRLEAESIPPF